MSIWFDAHLDLGCLAVNGRDMQADLDSCGGPWQPAGVSLPSLADGEVRFALGAVFTERGGDGPEGYAPDDIEMAHRRGRAQLEAYLTWKDMGLVAIDVPAVFADDPGVGSVRGGMGVSESQPISMEARIQAIIDRAPLHLGILMESADPIRSPDELEWWTERGVCAIGMAWWAASRYAGGNGTSDIGLTDLGRELARAMDDQGVVHDLSHLSQKSTDDLLEATDRPVIASHSNCRALLDGNNERHLSDATIREIGRRGGMIGVNLVSAFLRPGVFEAEQASSGDAPRAAIDDVLNHINRICEMTGDRTHVGLGSDMDGGFSTRRLPEGINKPADLERITAALREAGWAESEIEGFRWKNWARFFEAAASARPDVRASHGAE